MVKKTEAITIRVALLVFMLHSLTLKDEFGDQLDLSRRRIASEPGAKHAGRWGDGRNDSSKLTRIGEVVDRLVKVRVIQHIEEARAEDEGLSLLKEVHLGALQNA
jgi:hypothetical protein